MNRVLRFFSICTILAVLMGSIAIAFAQEEAKKEDTEYSYGKVIEIDKSANKMTITEYDWDNDKEATVIYTIHPTVEVENSPSWKEIPVGHYVDIEYVVNEKGEKVAKYIAAYEPETEEEAE